MCDLALPKAGAERQLRIREHAINLSKDRGRTGLAVAVCWLADHDIKFMFSQLNLLDSFEAQLAVNERVDGIAALKVTCSALEICHIGDVFDELAGVAFASGGCLCANVDEIPSGMVSTETSISNFLSPTNHCPGHP